MSLYLAANVVAFLVPVFLLKRAARCAKLRPAETAVDAARARLVRIRSARLRLSLVCSSGKRLGVELVVDTP
jgi:hypothetical protein